MFFLSNWQKGKIGCDSRMESCVREGWFDKVLLPSSWIEHLLCDNRLSLMLIEFRMECNEWRQMREIPSIPIPLPSLQWLPFELWFDLSLDHPRVHPINYPFILHVISISVQSLLFPSDSLGSLLFRPIGTYNYESFCHFASPQTTHSNLMIERDFNLSFPSHFIPHISVVVYLESYWIPHPKYIHLSSSPIFQIWKESKGL